jgi:hypothetical protein
VRFISKLYLFKRNRLAFKTTAKLTQSIYGSRSKAAGFDTFQKVKIVRSIAAHIMIISTSARPIRCSPKKRGVHNPFKNS